VRKLSLVVAGTLGHFVRSDSASGLWNGKDPNGSQKGNLRTAINCASSGTHLLGLVGYLNVPPQIGAEAYIYVPLHVLQIGPEAFANLFRMFPSIFLKYVPKRVSKLLPPPLQVPL
jgi:hypothetical protein